MPACPVAVSREGCCGGFLKESNASLSCGCIQRGMLWWFSEGKQCQLVLWLYPERDVVVVF